MTRFLDTCMSKTERENKKDRPQAGEECYCECEWPSKMRLTGIRIMLAHNKGIREEKVVGLKNGLKNLEALCECE